MVDPEHAFNVLEADLADDVTIQDYRRSRPRRPHHRALAWLLTRWFGSLGALAPNLTQAEVDDMIDASARSMGMTR